MNKPRKDNFLNTWKVWTILFYLPNFEMGSWNVAWLPIIKPSKECIFPNYNQEAADGKKLDF